MENQGGITTYHKKSGRPSCISLENFQRLGATPFQKKDEHHGGILSTDLGRNLHMSRTIQTFLKGACTTHLPCIIQKRKKEIFRDGDAQSTFLKKSSTAAICEREDFYFIFEEEFWRSSRKYIKRGCHINKGGFFWLEGKERQEGFC